MNTRKHVNRLPNTLTADHLSCVCEDEANVRAQRKEHMATLLKVGGAWRDKTMKGQKGEIIRSIRPLYLTCLFAILKSFSIGFCGVIVWYLCVSVHRPNTIHLCKHTTLSPSFPLFLQSMPISSACLVFDGACPPHRPLKRLRRSQS